MLKMFPRATLTDSGTVKSIREVWLTVSRVRSRTWCARAVDIRDMETADGTVQPRARLVLLPVGDLPL